jgi:DNA-directed RNA polymerase sigma subunit (sigma70/sigma32)
VFSVLSGRIAEAVEAAGQAAAAAELEAQQQQQQDAEMAAADGEGADADTDAQQQQQQQQDPEQQKADAEAAAAAKARAAQQLVLAQVRGFVMSVRSEVVGLGLTGRVLETVEGCEMGPEARAALLGPLGLA